MTTTRNPAALWIAAAAVAVNGPRLVLIFLQADGIAIPRGVEAAVLTITGIATGAVLTGGGMYIAHRLAEPGGSRAVRLILAGTWAALLVFSVVLIAPAMLLAWRHSPLAEIIPASADGWIIGPDAAWATVAVLAVEVLAGGVMAAHAMTGQPPARQESRPGRFSRLADALTDRLAGEIEAGGQPRPPAPGASRTQAAPATQEQADRPTSPDASRTRTGRATPPRRQHRPAEQPTEQPTEQQAALRRRHAALIAFLADNPQATDQQMADAIGRAKSTAQSHRAALEGAGVIHKNGHGWEVTA